MREQFLEVAGGVRGSLGRTGPGSQPEGSAAAGLSGGREGFEVEVGLPGPKERRDNIDIFKGCFRTKWCASQLWDNNLGFRANFTRKKELDARQRFAKR